MGNFIKSFIVGIFAIFPGVSGSTLAISLDIYDKFFYSLKNIKENYLFILLVVLGFCFGVIVGSNIIIYLSNYKKILYYAFAGLIIGTIPNMFQRAKRINYIFLIISFIISIITLFSCKNTLDFKSNSFKMLVGGIFFSFGKIFPGVSSSFFLIILGIYDEIIILFSNPVLIFSQISHYLPFILGALIGLIIFVKLLNYLILNKHDLLYSILIGLVLSSIISIVPKFELNFDNILGIALMMLGSVISFKFNKKKRFNLLKVLTRQTKI